MISKKKPNLIGKSFSRHHPSWLKIILPQRELLVTKGNWHLLEVAPAFRLAMLNSG